MILGLCCAGPRDLVEHGTKAQVTLAAVDSSSPFVAQRRALRRMWSKTLLSIILTIPILTLAWLPHSSNIVLKGSISLLFASFPQILVIASFYPNAYTAVFRNHVADVEVLTALSTSIAYIFSVVAFVSQVIGTPLARDWHVFPDQYIIDHDRVGWSLQSRRVVAYRRSQPDRENSRIKGHRWLHQSSRRSFCRPYPVTRRKYHQSDC